MIQAIPTLGEKNKRVFSASCQDLYKRLRRWVDFNIYRFSRWGVLQHFMELFRYFTKEVLRPNATKQSGPNTLEELLTQFDLPKKEKTKEEVIRGYQIFLTMAELELEMLRMAPPIKFYSHNWVDYEGGKAYYDWAPCIIRPEVVYSCYGKN